MSAPDHHPLRTRVVFDDVDVRAADVLIERFGGLAACLTPGAPTDERTIGRLIALTRSANASIAAGDAKGGLRTDRLAQGANYSSDNHVREQLDGPWVRLWAALMVRLLMAAYAPVLAEQVTAHAAPVGRDSRRAGFDDRPGVPKVKPLLRVHLASADRHLLSWQIPLLAQTTCDAGAAEANLEEIEWFQAAFGEPLPASLADHVRLALDERRQLLQVVRASAADHPDLLGEAGLDPADVVRRAFSPVVIMPALPHGSPRVKGERHSHLVMPGEDQALLMALAGAGMMGIAECRLPPDRAPARAVTLDPALAAAWGLTAPSWNTAFQVLGDDGLLRVDSSGFGVRPTLWRVFGMAPDDQRAAAAAERAAERWPRDCVVRADTASPPGKARPKNPAFRRTVMALGAVADAAHVTAACDRRAGRSS